ncbi:ABC-2 type transporter family protein, partial [Prunus dulcis]
VLCSNNGGEYVNKVLPGYFQEHGILHETTCPYTPQQNGVDEGKNHQNFEITHASLIEKGMMFLKHGPVKVVGHTYSDWAGKEDKKRSTFERHPYPYGIYNTT